MRPRRTHTEYFPYALNPTRVAGRPFARKNRIVKEQKTFPDFSLLLEKPEAVFHLPLGNDSHRYRTSEILPHDRASVNTLAKIFFG